MRQRGADATRGTEDAEAGAWGRRVDAVTPAQLGHPVHPDGHGQGVTGGELHAWRRDERRAIGGHDAGVGTQSADGAAQSLSQLQPLLDALHHKLPFPAAVELLEGGRIHRQQDGHEVDPAAKQIPGEGYCGLQVHQPDQPVDEGASRGRRQAAKA
jgi:hypothetical protein